MKILVPLKRVADPDNANKVKVNAGKLETTGLEWKPNPFDEYAVETALRLTENGASPKARQGEVIVVTFGPKETETTLRGALATGADRAIRVDATEQLDGDLVARRAQGHRREGEAGPHPLRQAGGRRRLEPRSVSSSPSTSAGLRPPSRAASPARTTSRSSSSARSTAAPSRSASPLPAVISVDLRIVAPKSVKSKHTADSHNYPDGVRFAALMAIMAAKKKPLVEMKLADLVGADVGLKIKYAGFELPPARKAGIKVKTVAELVEKLKSEAKAL